MSELRRENNFFIILIMLRRSFKHFWALKKGFIAYVYHLDIRGKKKGEGLDKSGYWWNENEDGFENNIETENCIKNYLEFK